MIRLGDWSIPQDPGRYLGSEMSISICRAYSDSVLGLRGKYYESSS